MNAITKDILTVENEEYKNAESVGELIIKVHRNRNCDKVTIVLDNAKYQTCKAIAEFAKELNIDLLFLPPYFPNLNIIKRLGSSSRNMHQALNIMPNLKILSKQLLRRLSQMT